jgi:hypothetical protein
MERWQFASKHGRPRPKADHDLKHRLRRRPLTARLRHGPIRRPPRRAASVAARHRRRARRSGRRGTRRRRTRRDGRRRRSWPRRRALGPVRIRLARRGRNERHARRGPSEAHVSDAPIICGVDGARALSPRRWSAGLWRGGSRGTSISCTSPPRQTRRINANRRRRSMRSLRTPLASMRSCAS